MMFSSWLAAHPFVSGMLTMLLPPLLGALFNWLTWKGTPEEWAVYRTAHPRKATAILVVRMILPHLRQIPKIAAFLPPASVKPPPVPELPSSASVAAPPDVLAEALAKISASTIPAPPTSVPDQPIAKTVVVDEKKETP